MPSESKIKGLQLEMNRKGKQKSEKQTKGQTRRPFIY